MTSESVTEHNMNKTLTDNLVCEHFYLIQADKFTSAAVVVEEDNNASYTILSTHSLGHFGFTLSVIIAPLAC